MESKMFAANWIHLVQISETPPSPSQDTVFIGICGLLVIPVVPEN